MTEQTIGVVGGGIVGLAVARELLTRRPGSRVVVFEKEDRVGSHQTGHNSGVVHAGLYYQPGSLKAELCTRGRALLREYCAERGLPYSECGKLVVAVDENELGRFETLVRTAAANGVPGLTRVGREGIGEIEPYAVGLAALHSPRTAITDYVAISSAYADDIVAAGGEVRLSREVTGVERGTGGLRVRTRVAHHDEVEQVQVDRLVTCAGLQADRVAAMAEGGSDGPRIVPFRGEYMAVADVKRELVRGMVYPVPDPRYPFLGVHFTRRVSGELEVGPNAVLALARESYRRSGVSLADVCDIATWPGTWHLARQHWRTGLSEIRGSLSIAAYIRSAQRYVPQIGAADVVRAGAGIRAQAVERDRSMVDDFAITHAGPVTSVRNAPSPAATSSLAIAEHVVDRVEEAGWA